jgi:hypothetical protein
VAVSVRSTTEVGLPAGAVGARLEDQISWHDRKAIHAQLRYKGLKLVQLTAAAAVPIAAALSAGEATTAALGGAILVVEGMQQIGQYHRNWIFARATCEALQREKHLYLAHAGAYARARDPARLLAERVEALVARETAGWTSAHQDEVREEDSRATR